MDQRDDDWRWTTSEGCETTTGEGPAGRQGGHQVDKGGTEKADKGGCLVVKLVTFNRHKKGEFKVTPGEQNVPAFATFVRQRKGENLHLGSAYRPASGSKIIVKWGEGRTALRTSGRTLSPPFLLGFGLQCCDVGR
jgi:hypothetical protein